MGKIKLNKKTKWVKLVDVKIKVKTIMEKCPIWALELQHI